MILSIMTLSITLISIMTFSITLISIMALSITLISIMTLSITLLSIRDLFETLSITQPLCSVSLCWVSWCCESLCRVSRRSNSKYTKRAVPLKCVAFGDCLLCTLSFGWMSCHHKTAWNSQYYEKSCVEKKEKICEPLSEKRKEDSHLKKKKSPLRLVLKTIGLFHKTYCSCK
jgi:hypothetical protein